MPILALVVVRFVRLEHINPHGPLCGVLRARIAPLDTLVLEQGCLVLSVALDVTTALLVPSLQRNVWPLEHIVLLLPLHQLIVPINPLL